MIEPGILYSTSALEERGITRLTLSEFRKETGQVPRVIGKRHWYYGQELIDWILSRPVVVTE